MLARAQPHPPRLLPGQARRIRLLRTGRGGAAAEQVELVAQLPGFLIIHRLGGRFHAGVNEAIARGLGFRTYASLREEVHSDREPVATADGAAFRQYLASHDFNVGSPPFYRAAGLAALKSVTEAYPRLTGHGIGIGPPKNLGGYWETSADRRSRFAEARANLVGEASVESFLLSLAFVQRVEPTKTIRPATNSYWLKHIAENYACTYPECEKLGPQYVANGVLIAAAMQAGFQLKTFMDDYGYESLNAGFNMRKASLYDLDCEIRPDGARAQSRRERERQRSQKGYNILY